MASHGARGREAAGRPWKRSRHARAWAAARCPGSSTSPRVSDATRAAVEAAVADLGHVPNTRGTRPRRQPHRRDRPRRPQPETRFFAEPYFSDMLRGVGAELSDTEMQLLLIFADGTGSGSASRSTWPRTASTAYSSSPSTPTTRCPTSSPSWRSRP